MPFNLSVEMIIEFVRNNQSWAPLIIFLMAFAETIIILSIFVPSTILFIAISGLMGAAGVPLLPTLIAGGIGSALGFSLMYLLTATMHGRILTAWPLKNYPDTIARAQEFSRRWGTLGVMIGHFSGPLRVMIPIAAGLSRLPPVPFMIANIIGAFAWMVTYFAPGYLLVASPWFKQATEHLKIAIPGI